ncbi:MULTISPECIES: RNA polymerase sigma factor [unclassified Blastomonas]|uniref:RNA polymerase sigma factor n=1 Tax=unclassified Blastomonas TaxID=2626550 RepID=UPI0008241181|nr:MULTISPECIES: RNA polymerase sigma factor [unclassified Blastomonas]
MSVSLGDGSDAEVVALALAGRQDAYRELLARYREPVYRFIRASTGEAQEALDLTQDTFIAAFAALDRYDRSRPLLTWLRRIALNKCRDWGRRRRLRAMLWRTAPIDTSHDVIDDAIAADVLVADRAELFRVNAAIAQLPARLRETLILRTIEGLGQAETAEVLGISEKAVETRLYRARSKLTDMLANEGPRTNL